ncbi:MULTISPECIES: ribonuclease G [unclassified Wenzhouxiangella]|uniref:ribonuclease G n=1 Tax=unclassified Wenzhouxiangella TaxID=2613841 RepID=UPI000E325278|nr:MULTISPECIES: ribonuclease G [unclassified Wenzhouxiangella]RFF28429.1 ribonuclease G [Wenzhouxiangella sp. 15181]RFP69946.1 ribonuclease G [Wenzhouxiangella sp. 15190]
MSDEILINVSPTERRVAVVESGLLQELYLERSGDTSYVGNIYMGRIERVLPGMQAAFVNIGLERTAFLHATDIVPRQPELDEEGEARPIPLITELVSQGQKLLVQVIKDPLGTKGARLTTQLSIPSRYLVLLPGVTSLGVSVRIEAEIERERLRGLLRELTGEEPEHGFIIRTNAEGIESDALARDLKYVRRLWPRIEADADQAVAGQLVYEDLSLPYRSLRDLMHAGIEKVRIDERETFQRAVRFAGEFFPEWADRIEFYDGEGPLFDLYGVETEIERALDRSTPLKSGGHLTIDQTEAMTTVDVNTGSYLGYRNLEETIYKTNLEAAQAIARQLRLRNLGGIIIIDFIDMSEDDHKRQVLRTLQRALSRDHARTTVSEISPLGLVEMTRKRTTESLEHRLCESCPSCDGSGRVKSVDTVCSEIFREIMRAVRQFETGQMRVMACPAVVDRMLEEHHRSIAELTEQLGTSIQFQPEEQYDQEQFDVVLL